MEKLRRELEEKRAEALRAQSALNSKETVRISSLLVFLLLTFASVNVYICAIDAYCDFFPVSPKRFMSTTHFHQHTDICISS